MNINKVKGIISAPFSPYSESGDLNTAIVPQYAQHLKAQGASGVFVCGTTGEGLLLTEKERKELAEAWIDQQTEEFKVIVHVGTTSPRSSADLASHAQQHDAYAIASMAPTFLKPTKVSQLVTFCAEIAEWAPSLPFYFYHIPPITGVNLPMVDFIQQAQLVIPTLAGLKFTHNNMMEMQQLLALDQGKWDILHGYDEMLLAGLSFGAQGAVGSTYNFALPLYLELIKDFEKGNINDARIKQLKSVALVDMLIRHGGVFTAGKAIMKMMGIDCGLCRAPLENLSNQEIDSLQHELEQIGLFDSLQS